MSRTCVIVGLDGFDPDVLANLVLFYTACGFDVSSSQAPADCDLLVIQRGTYSGQEFETRAAECHVYDYVRNGTSDLHRSFPNIGAIAVISPTAPASGSTTPSNLIRSFHPVIAELWTNRDTRPRRPYRVVHVGHRKSNAANDRWLEQMDRVALSGACHMWGSGWQELSGTDAATLHEPATLHQCQGIYRQAESAFGVMYPMQRTRTISGRAWQGPLNGCIVYSEAVVPDAEIPGLIACDDFLAALHGPPASVIPPAELIAAAAAYWNGVTASLARELGLSYVRPAPSLVRSTYAREVFLRHVTSRTRQVLRRA